MTSNQTPTPDTDGTAQDSKRFVYIDEAPKNARGIEEMIADAKASGAEFVRMGDESRGEGKALQAEATESALRLAMKTPVVPRVEHRKAARAERRNAARGE